MKHAFKPELNAPSHDKSCFKFDPATFKGADKCTMNQIQSSVVGACKDSFFFETDFKLQES